MKILAIGNELRKDDGIALEIAEELGALKAFTNPENFIQEGEEVIIIDAVDYGAEPGSVKEFNPERIADLALSTTHDINIGLLQDFCKIIKVIGVQPEDVSHGRGISQTLLTKKEEITAQVKELINK